MSVDRSLLADPVGIGIKTPIVFERGKLRLTASTRIQVSSDDGLGGGGYGVREVLVATDDERKTVIRQSMARILKTPQESRFMLGQYGSLVDLVPFEVNDPTTHALVAAYAATALEQGEQRIELLDVDAGFSPDSEITVDVNVAYRIRGTAVTDDAVILERQTEVSSR